MESVIEVHGEGAATLAAQHAVLRVQIAVRAAHASQAFTQAAEHAQRALELIEQYRASGNVQANGVDAHQVTLWPYSTAEHESQSFDARRSVSVRCRDLATAGDLFEALLARVGDPLTLESITMETTAQPDELAQARAAAWRDAHQRAEQWAQLAGVRLAEAVEITEGEPMLGAPVALRAERGLVAPDAAVTCRVRVRWRTESAR